MPDCRWRIIQGSQQILFNVSHLRRIFLHALKHVLHMHHIQLQKPAFDNLHRDRLASDNHPFSFGTDRVHHQCNQSVHILLPVSLTENVILNILPDQILICVVDLNLILIRSFSCIVSAYSRLIGLSLTPFSLFFISLVIISIITFCFVDFLKLKFWTF